MRNSLCVTNTVWESFVFYRAQIRSHMKIGPVELTMQIRTKNGIKRTGATLPIIRAHTVTRVNHEGSEMVDFLLDRLNL
jgi:hypothetical protein